MQTPSLPHHNGTFLLRRVLIATTTLIILLCGAASLVSAELLRAEYQQFRSHDDENGANNDGHSGVGAAVGAIIQHHVTSSGDRHLMIIQQTLGTMRPQHALPAAAGGGGRPRVQIAAAVKPATASGLQQSSSAPKLPTYSKPLSKQ